MQEYQENAARLGWLIDHQNRTVEIYRPGQAVDVTGVCSRSSAHLVKAFLTADAMLILDKETINSDRPEP